jgi:hypothetical protein
MSYSYEEDPDDEDDEPLDVATLESARRALSGVDNPIGKQLVAGLFDEETMIIGSLARHTARVAANLAADRAATLATLALRRYERRHGRLPERLERLVDAGLLDELPADSYSRTSLLYSRERRRLWSVGENGVDDGGFEFDAVEREDDDEDPVWRLPKSR